MINISKKKHGSLIAIANSEDVGLRGLVADTVFPKVVTETENFRFKIVNNTGDLRVANTNVNERSNTHEILPGDIREESGTVQYQALKGFVSKKGADNIDTLKVTGREQRALKKAIKGLALKRELDAINKMTDIAAFQATGSHTSLSGSPFNVSGNAKISDVLESILKDGLYNTLVMGASIERLLLRDPNYTGNVNSRGKATLEDFKRYHNLETVAVSRARQNLAGFKEVPNIQYIKDDFIWIGYVDRDISINGEDDEGYGFGFTAVHQPGLVGASSKSVKQYGDQKYHVRLIDAPDEGVFGGYYTHASRGERIVICDTAKAHLITDLFAGATYDNY